MPPGLPQYVSSLDQDSSHRPCQRRATFVYRGQLDVELSRISFLLEVASKTFEAVDIVLLSPGLGASASEFETFGRSFPSVRNITFLDAGRFSAFRVRRQLRQAIAPDAAIVIAVGFSATAYLPGRSCAVWCVNGIPEERLLHGSSVRNRAAVWLAWRQARKAAAIRTVVVSDPMAELMAARTSAAPVVIPNAVDRTIFRPDPTILPDYLTYQGGGSPWQGLDRLAAIWKELNRLDPSLKFRVITNDDRAKRLAVGLPDDCVDVQSADDHRDVAALLQEAKLGFLVREPGIVNKVSWPMKLGEYLGCGAPVAVTRCEWDAERLVERCAAGLVLDWSASPESSAERILAYLREVGSERPAGVENAAAELDSVQWATVLSNALLEAADAMPSGGVANAR